MLFVLNNQELALTGQGIYLMSLKRKLFRTVSHNSVANILKKFKKLKQDISVNNLAIKEVRDRHTSSACILCNRLP